MIIGLGTGSLYKLIDPASREAVEIVRRTGANAIELCGVRAERFDRNSKHNFFNLTRDDLKGFDYVSIHAPCDIVYRDDDKTHGLLDLIQELYERLDFKLAVFHPDLVENSDFSVFEGLGFPFAFENMDFRKKVMKQPYEIRNLFDSFNGAMNGFVFDVTHAYTVDSTGKLGRQFVDQCSDILSQIHFSGHFVHGEDEQQHYPAHLEEMAWNGGLRILPHKVIYDNVKYALSVRSEIPLIIESVFPKETISESDRQIVERDPTFLILKLKRELDFAKGYLD